MADNIKEEFKTYIKTLTETISKEIFLEELKAVCEKYTVQMEQNKELADNTLQMNQTVMYFTKSNINSVKKLENNVKKELGNIKNIIEQINAEYADVFQGFSEKVSILNEEERKKYIDVIDNEIISCMNESMNATIEMLKEFFSDTIKVFQEISQENNGYYRDFQALIEENKKDSRRLFSETQAHTKVAQKLDKTVNTNLKNINKTIENITKEAGEVFKNFSSDVTKLNDEERKKFCSDIDILLKEYRFVFSEDVKEKYQHIANSFQTDLSKIYEEYYERITDYRKMLQKAEEDIEKLDNHTVESVNKIDSFHNEIKGIVENLYQAIEKISLEYRDVFQGYSERVSELNEIERGKFREEIQEIIETYRMDFSEEIDKQSNAVYEKFEKNFYNIQEEFKDVISDYKDISEKVLESNSNNYKASLYNIKGLKILNNNLQIAIKDSNEKIENAVSNLTKEQGEKTEEILRYAKQFLKRVEEERKQLLEENSQLKKGLQEQQQEFLRKIQENQAQGQEQLLERLKKKQISDEKFIESIAWKTYMSISNAVLIFMMILYFVMFQPWYYFGEKNTIILLSVIAAFILLILCRKKIIEVIVKFLKR